LLWEIVDSQDQQTQASQTNSTGTSRKSAWKSNMSPNHPKPILVIVHIPHKDKIPHWMHEFIENLVAVPGDGHCGFRAVAGLLN